jgi:hypothetical protein
MSPRRRRRRQPAQVMVLFGLSLVGIMALLALVFDGATIYLQRRTAQNAADAAALAGTRTLENATTSPGNAVAVAVCTYLQANSFGALPTATAYLVDGNGQYVQPLDLTNGAGGAACSGSPASSILAGAGGVHVDASITFRTFVLGTLQRLLHVGPQDWLTARASATAHVWDQSVDGNNLAPFATCGGHAPIDTNGTLANLFISGTTTIDPALYDTTTVILEDSQINAGSAGWLKNYPPPACPDDSGSSWKGDADPPDSQVTLPANIPTVHGNRATDVGTPCTNTGQPDPDLGTCYLWVPVTDNHNADRTAHVVVLACMQMVDMLGDPKWAGILKDPAFCPYTPFQANWTWSPGVSTANTRISLTL